MMTVCYHTEHNKETKPMTDLIEVKKGELLVDSQLVARKFGMVHSELAKRIVNTLKDYPDIQSANECSEHSLISEKYTKETRHYRGTDFEVYMMNREFFSLVAMRLTSKKARQWQRKFNAAFYAMERRLLTVETNAVDVEWNSSRLIGKTARLEETEAIKDFVEYATKQGSTKARYYYKHVTDASYKALGIMSSKYPKLRDELNIYELSELMLAERLAARKLREYMKLGRNYKDIYQSVKDDLMTFANALRLTA